MHAKHAKHAKRSRIASWGRWTHESVRVIRIGEMYYLRLPTGWSVETPYLEEAIIWADYAAG